MLTAYQNKSIARGFPMRQASNNVILQICVFSRRKGIVIILREDMCYGGLVREVQVTKELSNLDVIFKSVCKVKGCEFCEARVL